MKKLLPLLLVLIFIFTLAACSGENGGQKDGKVTDSNASETSIVSEKYADSEFCGVWINADTKKETVEFELKADGTAVMREKDAGTWEPTDEGIKITVTADGKETEMNGYFIIAGDGFAARYNDANLHYIEDGKGEKQLEIMLTENTCVDCIKK